MGLIVPKKDRKLFYNPRTDKKPKAGWGTQINKARYHLNNAFPKLGIPLRMIYHSIDIFEDLEDFRNFLFLIEKEDKDVIACFDFGTLYNTKYYVGHVAVIDEFS